jgi:hypothetical protein
VRRSWHPEPMKKKVTKYTRTENNLIFAATFGAMSLYLLFVSDDPRASLHLCGPSCCWLPSSPYLRCVACAGERTWTKDPSEYGISSVHGPSHGQRFPDSLWGSFRFSDILQQTFY